MEEKPALKIVTLNQHPIAYELISKWIQSNEHHHVLTVTSPDSKSSSPSHQQIVKAASRDVDVLVTTRMKRVAEPLIQKLKPDLLVCFSFAYRLSTKLCKIPKYGAINVHLSVLPAYRGPNIMRQFYDGAPVFGATVHWIAEEYDAGNILSQRSVPLPNNVTRETIPPIWIPLILETISEGVEKAVAGDVGEKQNDSRATYAAPYSDEEYWLNWNESRQIIQRKEMALNLLRPRSAKARIGNEDFVVTGLEIIKAEGSSKVSGEVIERSPGNIIVRAADGLIRATVEPI